MAAAQEAGFPFNPDVTGAAQEGAGPFQATIGPKGRASVAATFLRPVMDRPNLHVLTHAHVTRILIEDGRATGVAFVHIGRSQEARAGEVILCGGAINSPQILMLSGIGPDSHLADLGIALEHDLPGVGQHLQDHLQVVPRFQIDQPATVYGMTDGPRPTRRCALSADSGTGPFHTNFCEAGAFLKLGDHADWPDIQIHCESHYSPHYFDGSGADRHGFGLLHERQPPEKPGRGAALFGKPARPSGDRPALPVRPRRSCAVRARHPGLPSDRGRPRAWRPRTHSRPIPRRTQMTRTASSASSAASPRRSGTRLAPAAWGRMPCRSSMTACASTASTGCASPMPRSCPRSSAATPTPPAS